jgi:hypothetical protein
MLIRLWRTRERVCLRATHRQTRVREGEAVIWSGSEHPYREKDFRIRDCLFVLTEKERLWRLIEEEGKQHHQA